MDRREFLKRSAVALAGQYLPVIRGQAQAPNVVLVMADDLGWADIGPYGQRLIATPNLDALAAGGARLTNFYSGAPVCSPARYSLLTGHHLGRTEFTRNWAPFGAGDVLLPQLLAAAGYKTAVFGKWGNGRLGDGNAPADYFDASFGYVDHQHAHDSWPLHLIENGNYHWLRENRHAQATFAPGQIASKALAFVERVQQPFFLYAPITLPHANNEAGELEVPDTTPFQNRDWPEAEKRYASMVWRIDWLVGQLMARLAARGLLENTLFLFTADNGPHSDAGHKPNFFGGNPWRGQKGLLYEGGIRVPLIAHWPGRIPAGQVVEQAGWFPDLLPTVAAAAGVGAGALSLDGIDLLPHLTGAAATAVARRLYWRFERQGVLWEAVRLGSWKGVRQGEGATALYNLAVDGQEQNDVAAQRPEIVAAIEVIMARRGA